MAALLGLAGGVGLVAGMVALGSGIALLMTKAGNPLLSMLAASPSTAIAMIASAAVLLLLSQMARATFDAAARGHDEDNDNDD